MLFANPRTLPALLLCVGFALAGYRWYEMRQIPQLDPKELAMAVELNYALDMVRAEKAGEELPSQQQRLDAKAAIRDEVLGAYAAERDQMQTQINQGLVAGLLGLALYIGVLILQRRGVIS